MSFNAFHQKKSSLKFPNSQYMSHQIFEIGKTHKENNCFEMSLLGLKRSEMTKEKNS